MLTERAAALMKMSDGDAQKEAAYNLSSEVHKEIDRRASRAFSLYGEQAKTNGYGWQATLIENQILPGIAQSIAELTNELNSIDNNLLEEIRTLVPKRWVDKAQDAEMKEDFEFIYAYTSRLLHATPSSLITDQKNLEPDEIQMFLRYVQVRMLDAIDLAQDLLSTATMSH